MYLKLRRVPTPDNPRNPDVAKALEGRDAHPIYDGPRPPLPISTPRILIRKFSEDDRSEVVRLLTHKDVMHYMGGPRSVENANRSFDAILKRTELVHYAPWAMVHRETSQMIGWCGIQVLKFFNEIELFYALFPENQRKGFALEASKSLVAAAFQIGCISELVALVHPDNVRSTHLLQKLGFEFVAKKVDPETGLTAPMYCIRRDNYSPYSV